MARRMGNFPLRSSPGDNAIVSLLSARVKPAVGTGGVASGDDVAQPFRPPCRVIHTHTQQYAVQICDELAGNGPHSRLEVTEACRCQWQPLQGGEKLRERDA